MKERYRRMMEQVSLSDGARAALLSELERPAGRRARPMRAAVIAACVCLALAGAALAAQVVTHMGAVEFEHPSAWDEANATERPLYGFSVEYGEGEFIPVTDLSPSVQELTKTTWVEFNSWEELEDYLGLKLMTNPVLSGPRMERRANYNMEEMGLSSAVHCCGQFSFDSEGGLSTVLTKAHYTIDPEPPENAVYVDVQARINVSGAVENGTDYYAEDGIYWREEDVAGLSEFVYTAPSGLSARVVTVDRTNGETQYHANFSLNGVLFQISVSGPKAAMDILEEILNAFET